MYDVYMAEASKEFASCWDCAWKHLNQSAGGAINSWIRFCLEPPILEHLSFRWGNQLFFIRITDIDGNVEGPSTLDGLFQIADACKGYACIMPMRNGENGWEPVLSGWGLMDARTEKSLTPPELVSDELIEITDWELHDFAVQIVRNSLIEQEIKLYSWCTDPAVFPSLWFEGPAGPEWVIVKATRSKNTDPQLSDDWREAAESCRERGDKGNLACVELVPCDDSADGKIYRGHPCTTDYAGLVPLDLKSNPIKIRNKEAPRKRKSILSGMLKKFYNIVYSKNVCF